MDTPTISPEAFSGRNWSREQVMLAFHFYCQTPFGQLNGKNRKVIALAKLLNRTPDAVAMKCCNLASLDPAIIASGRVGLKGASTLDQEIWAEFHADWERLAVECEQMLHYLRRQHGIRAPKAQDAEDPIPTDFTGETRQILVQQRIKQDFFRRAVLSGYRGHCCITGVSDARFLIASHIIPWSQDKTNRLNPSNGLCLSTIHDKAFDRHLFSLTDDHRVLLSEQLKSSKDTFLQQVFWPFDDRPIQLPDRFRPEPSFIRNHRDAMLRNQA